jgi:hypothetical protein
MDRAAATTFLTSEYAELAGEAKFTTDQANTAYSTAIDMSLRQLGYQEVDLATTDTTQTQTLGYLALLNYYTLKRFVRIFTIKYDVNIANNTVFAYRSQIFKAMQQLLTDAEQECLKLGFDVGGGPSFQMGYLNLDFNEPGGRWLGGDYVDFYGF